jgi:hypothetical protein
MTTCAAIGCDIVVVRRPGPGRPPIYCSPACRPSPARPAIVVELDHPEESTDGRDARRVWTVRLRRGRRVVVIAENLGWPSASALAGQLTDLLRPAAEQRGGDLD